MSKSQKRLHVQRSPWLSVYSTSLVARFAEVKPSRCVPPGSIYNSRDNSLRHKLKLYCAIYARTTLWHTTGWEESVRAVFKCEMFIRWLYNRQETYRIYSNTRRHTFIRRTLDFWIKIEIKLNKLLNILIRLLDASLIFDWKWFQSFASYIRINTVNTLLFQLACRKPDILHFFGYKDGIIC